MHEKHQSLRSPCNGTPQRSHRHRDFFSLEINVDRCRWPEERIRPGVRNRTDFEAIAERAMRGRGRGEVGGEGGG